MDLHNIDRVERELVAQTAAIIRQELNRKPCYINPLSITVPPFSKEQAQKRLRKIKKLQKYIEEQQLKDLQAKSEVEGGISRLALPQSYKSYY